VKVELLERLPGIPADSGETMDPTKFSQRVKAGFRGAGEPDAAVRLRINNLVDRPRGPQQ
jgi:hypothetical protein